MAAAIQPSAVIPCALPRGARGFFITLRRDQSSSTKVNAAIEATALVHSASKALAPSISPPLLEAHAIIGAPGALLVEVKDALDVVAVSHKALEDAMPAPGESLTNLIRLLPVEAIVDALPDAVMAAVKPLLDQHGLGEDGPALSFAVRSEEHSTELSHGNACELVRRVAELVPPIHKVDLTNGKKTVLLILVCDACLLSVVDDYHALHRYNVHQAIQAMPKEQ